MKLRVYQQECVDTIWNEFHSRRNVLAVMATGAGKTECMMEFILRVFEKMPTFKVCILLNKVDLLDQTVKRFRHFFGGSVSISEYCGSNDERDHSKSIVIATIQSIESITIEGLNLIIIDEVHNFNPEEGRYKRFLDRNPSKVLGLTATPFRNNEGYIYGEGKFFECVSYDLGILDLIKRGYLVEPRLKQPEHQFDTSKLSIKMGDFSQSDIDKMTDDHELIGNQIEDALRRLEGRKKVVWACSSIKHAEFVSSQIKDSVVLHSQLGSIERADAFYNFIKGNARHLVFITIVSEGFDFPPIDGIVLMRPTRSPNLYVQTVGRGLRLSPGKKDCLVLDYGEVVMNCGPINQPIVRKKGERGSKDAPVKVCPKCQELMHAAIKICPACGFLFEQAESKLTKKPENLFEIIGNKPKYMDVSSVTLSRHKSKAGNDCLKISYQSKNLLENPLQEFFQISNNWAAQRAYLRLSDMGVSFSENIDDIVAQPIKRVPKTVEWNMDGKYKKILKVSFV